MPNDTIQRSIYPLTIVSDRYNGVYSGGKYTAWNLDIDDIPTAIVGDDVDCHNFWLENTTPVGKGDTVEEAIENLHAELKKSTETVIDYREVGF